MTIQQIVAELNNIKEQAVNHDEVTKNSIVEAITDLIHDAGGSDGLDIYVYTCIRIGSGTGDSGWKVIANLTNATN